MGLRSIHYFLWIEAITFVAKTSMITVSNYIYTSRVAVCLPHFRYGPGLPDRRGELRNVLLLVPVRPWRGEASHSFLRDGHVLSQRLHSECLRLPHVLR